MDYKDLLNERQFEAVSTTSQYVRVVAGAGSGKTRVLTYRISYLIGELNYKPSSIVAIAFTNKVASEMKDRALQLLKGKGQGVRVSTFHSFCAKFLRQEISVLNFPNNFTIFDDEDQMTLIKSIATDNGYKKNDEIVKKTASFISYNKCIGQYPEDIKLSSYASEEMKKIVEMYEIYEDRKSKMVALDFDDLLLKTIYILRNFDGIRQKTRDSISNLLIDEFQDTNDVQFELVKLLLNPTTNLFVVGDPDQTIYTWRGANQDIIMNFEFNFRNSQTIILDQNYRSTKNILNSANKLISYNKKRVPKNLYTSNNDGAIITAKSFKDRDSEAKFVIDEIERTKRSNPSLSYRDFAVLYRAAYLTMPFESELMRRGIPYQIYGGIKFFQRKEIKDALAYFRVIYNTNDDISYERIINVPRRNIGKETINHIKFEKDSLGLSFFEYVEQIEENKINIKPLQKISLKHLNDEIKSTRDRLAKNEEAYPQVLADFIEKIGYYNYLMNDDEADDRLANVKTLIDNIVDFLKQNPQSNFEEYLENAALQSSQDEINNQDSVLLMTVHVAKGLEFPYVFVVSLIDGVFPSRRTVEDGEDGLEEERRLCYVAFTRAKEKLYVTYNTGYSFVLGSSSSVSQFLDEAGLKIQSGYQGNYESNIQRRTYFNDFTPDYVPNKSGYYSDINPRKEEEKINEKIEEEFNNITDWKVGDKVFHKTFGDGVVTQIISEQIIRIEFEKEGLKTLMSNHKFLQRK